LFIQDLWYTRGTEKQEKRHNIRLCEISMDWKVHADFGLLRTNLGKNGLLGAYFKSFNSV